MCAGGSRPVGPGRAVPGRLPPTLQHPSAWLALGASSSAVERSRASCALSARSRGAGGTNRMRVPTGGLRLSPHHRGVSDSLTNEVRCGDAEGSLSDRGCEGRDLGAASEGGERGRDRPAARVAEADGEQVSPEGGRDPAAAASSAERCLTLAEREDISRGIDEVNRRARSVAGSGVRTPRCPARSTVAVAVGAIALTRPSGRRGSGRDARERRSSSSVASCVSLSSSG